MLFLTWYSTGFAREVALGLSQLHNSLSLALDEGLGYESTDGSLKHGPGGHRPILDAILKRSVMLNTSYSQAAFELRVGRLSGLCQHPTVPSHINFPDLSTFSQIDPSVHQYHRALAS